MRGRYEAARECDRAACATRCRSRAPRRWPGRRTAACRASLHTTVSARSCCASCRFADPFEQAEQRGEIVLTLDAQDEVPDAAHMLGVERKSREMVELAEQLVLGYRAARIALR